MTVTVAANGLSIVHQGSGGEANATLPDVCLTTVGNVVIPIPYGNNAKSANLAGGTTTITMDGGKSVAIKGSTFSASTGDAGGDKKGIASGSIEGEAKFISSSPTVMFEGMGVCRLSDQMTMNKANTMCLGGAQNPSVTVTGDEEGTYTVDIKITYANGDGFQAPFKLVDSNGNSVGDKLDEQGERTVPNLKPGKYTIEFDECCAPYKPFPKFDNTDQSTCFWSDEKVSSHEKFAQKLINKCKGGRSGFWKKQGIMTDLPKWGEFVGDFLGVDSDAHEMLTNTILYSLPCIAGEKEAQEMATCILSLSQKDNQSIGLIWRDFVMLALGTAPEIGMVMKAVCEATINKYTRNELLANLRYLGEGDVVKFLNELKWTSKSKGFCYHVTQVVTLVVERFNLALNQLESKAKKSGHLEYEKKLQGFQSQISSFQKSASNKIVAQTLKQLKNLMDKINRRDNNVCTIDTSGKGIAQHDTYTGKVNQRMPGILSRHCWLCGKQISQKANDRTKQASATHCIEGGHDGHLYERNAPCYGLAVRGEGTHQWNLLDKHNKRKQLGAKGHPLYARCYDGEKAKDENGKEIIIKLNRSGHEYGKEYGIVNPNSGKKEGTVGSILQAHHIISVNEMQMNHFLRARLPHLGYDLNDYYNTVVLPSIPELACFYEMPLHCGPHPTPYTSFVKECLEILKRDIRSSDFCNISKSDAAKNIISNLNKISKDVYYEIFEFSEKGAIVANNHRTYKAGYGGCCNQLTHIKEESTNWCVYRTLDRLHERPNHDFRRMEGKKIKRVEYEPKKKSELGV